MRPRVKVIVVGYCPEIRFMLRTELPVAIAAAEDIAELIAAMRDAITDQLIVIDARDAPVLAARAAAYINGLRAMTKTILVVPAAQEEEIEDPFCDYTIRNGQDLSEQLIHAVKLALMRKRGPLRKIIADAVKTA